MGNLHKAKAAARMYRRKKEGDYASQSISERVRPVATETKVVVHEEVGPSFEPERNWQYHHPDPDDYERMMDEDYESRRLMEENEGCFLAVAVPIVVGVLIGLVYVLWAIATAVLG